MALSRQRFEPAELFRIVADLALEAVTARELSDDPEDRELLDLYRDALFQFEGFEHPDLLQCRNRTPARSRLARQ